MNTRIFSTAAVACLLFATPAHAELAQPVRALIEAAIATGDEGKVNTVIELARLTNPDDLAEIEALRKGFAVQLAQKKAAEKKAKEEEIRFAGVLDNWKGKAEIGASRSTGNGSNTGFTGSLQLDRAGIDWSHKLRARADYQRHNGRTTREQYFAAYEPRYQMSKRLFAYGLAQYESNRFQGFDARYAVSGGFGYRLIDGKDLNLSIKAGPALRSTRLVSGEREDRIAGLLGLDFDWRITDRLTLSQDTNLVAETGGEATLIVDSNSTTLNLVTSLDAKVSDRLTTRLSYTIEYDDNPPPGAIRTDTLSRFTLVYGF